MTDRRFGPFEILERNGDLNYRLKLPAKYQIHPVFHVNLLTRHEQSHLVERPPQSRPDPELVDEVPEYEVEEILDSRVRGRRKEVQFLLKWKGYPLDEASWEP